MRMKYEPVKTDENLDEYLKLALDHLKEKWSEPKVGFVSCIIKDGKNVVFSTNTFEDNGKIVHAERNGIDLFEQKYGKISKNAIIVVTLSPCIVYSKNRIGSSCSSLLRDKEIKMLHFGYLHEKQGSLETYERLGFIPSVTKDLSLSSICENLLNLYLSNKNDLMNNIDSWLRVKREVGVSIFNQN